MYTHIYIYTYRTHQSDVLRRGVGYCLLRYCCLESLGLPRIARQGTVCLINFNKRISSNNSN